MRAVHVFTHAGRDSLAQRELIYIRNTSCFGSEFTPDKFQMEILQMLNILTEHAVQEIFFTLIKLRISAVS